MEGLKQPTRADYLAKRCTFQEYYGAIAKTVGLKFSADADIVKRSRRALANGDEHLNTIPLHVWDRLAISVSGLPGAFRQHGDHCSMAGAVCVVKTAVRLAVEG